MRTLDGSATLQPMRTLGGTLTLLLILAFAGCGDDSSESSDTPSDEPTPEAVTGSDVTAALEAADIEIINPRDNTHGCGTGDDDIHCTELLTTDVFSVHVWATAEDAQRWVDASLGEPPIVLGELTTVSFQEGGTTPDYDLPAHQAALEPLG